MKTIKLDSYLADIKARKERQALADLPDTASCRNGGARRIANKRAALRHAKNRAKAAGVQTIRANY